MWELVCDHRYDWGAIAADRSPWHSDGRVSSAAPLSGEPGLRFSTPQSRVVIPRKTNDPWGQMRAIHVEFVASSQQAGGTIIDADGCFRASFDGPQAIVIQVLGSSQRYEIDGLPLGNWVSFQFTHDGVNGLTHGYGWTAPLEEGSGGGSPINVPGQVPPVGPQGIWIGNQIGNPNRHLNGAVQSVKIWRHNPNSMIPPFLGRPFDPGLLECWASFMRKLNEFARQNPDCASWASGTIGRIHDDLFAALAQKDPTKLAEFWDFCAAYQKLWAAGKVGSSEMQELITRLRDWLNSEHLFSVNDPDITGVLENPCIKKLAEAVGTIECDAEVLVLLKAILGVPNGQTRNG